MTRPVGHMPSSPYMWRKARRMTCKSKVTDEFGQHDCFDTSAEKSICVCSCM